MRDPSAGGLITHALRFRHIQRAFINGPARDRATVTAYDGRERVKEADLSGHLTNADSKKRKKAAAKAKDVANPLLASDNQLYEALTLLKGINILGMREKNVEQNKAGKS